MSSNQQNQSYRDIERGFSLDNAYTITANNNKNNNNMPIVHEQQPQGGAGQSYRDIERSYRPTPHTQNTNTKNTHLNDGGDDESIEIGYVGQQPFKYREMNAEQMPQPDYHTWSTASLFLCFIWGIFAFRASERVRKFNKLREYNHAAYHSKEALRKFCFFCDGQIIYSKLK